MKESPNVFTANWVVYVDGKDPQFFHTKTEAERCAKQQHGRAFQWDKDTKSARAFFDQSTGRWEQK